VLLAPRHFHAHPGFGQRLLDRQGNVAHLAAALRIAARRPVIVA
jgi:hypothetical protein